MNKVKPGFLQTAQPHKGTDASVPTWEWKQAISHGAMRWNRQWSAAALGAADGDSRRTFRGRPGGREGGGLGALAAPPQTRCPGRQGSGSPQPKQEVLDTQGSFEEKQPIPRIHDSPVHFQYPFFLAVAKKNLHVANWARQCDPVEADASLRPWPQR